MTLAAAPTDETVRIGRLIEDWAEAVRASDLDGIMAAYAPDILSFDAIAQLRFKGTAAYREHWKACLAMCPGAMIFEIHDLEIAAGETLAFSHYLVRCGAMQDGEEKAGYMRATVCHRRTNGRWLIVHEHFSAPFDPASGKALLDLEP